MISNAFVSLEQLAVGRWLIRTDRFEAHLSRHTFDETVGMLMAIFPYDTYQRLCFIDHPNHTCSSY